MTASETSRDSVRIRLYPYAVDFVHEADAQTLVPSRLGDVGWCSLPDILFVPSSREFIGLSFPVDREHQAFSRRLAQRANDARARYLEPSDPAFRRYAGLGDAHRLELCWQHVEGDVECEFASLFEGFWFEDGAAQTDPLAMIRGYCLLDLEQILQDHRLSPPSCMR